MNASNPPKSSDQVENKSERSGSTNQFVRLQRAVVKLVFSFHGQNPQLDERLERLGVILKSAPKSAAALSVLEEVVDQVIAADIGHGSPAHFSRQLADLIGQLHFETDAVADCKTLQRRLTDATTRDLGRLSRETALFINRQLNHRARGYCFRSRRGAAAALVEFFEN